MMKLLAVGRCFAGIVDEPSRYKMNINLLPKFPTPRGGAKLSPARVGRMEEGVLFDENLNPVLPMPAARAVGERSGRSFTAEVGAEKAGPEVALSCGSEPGLVLAESAQGFVERKVEGGALLERRSQRGRRAGWLSGLFGGKRARVGREMLVQGELALEAIRVVRNDLSDADLELAPAKSKGTEGEARRERERSGGGRGVIWSELTARLFAMRRIGS
jgi:hypothetical protein